MPAHARSPALTDQMEAAIGRHGPVDQTVAGDLREPQALRQLGFHDRRMAGDLQDIGVNGHDDPARFDPQLLGGPDHQHPGGRGTGLELYVEFAAESAGPGEGQRLLGQAPPRLDERLVIDGLGIPERREAARPVPRPADAQGPR